MKIPKIFMSENRYKLEVKYKDNIKTDLKEKDVRGKTV